MSAMWSGSLPVGWKIRAVGELCEINPPKSAARRILTGDKPVSFLPMNDLGILTKIVRTEQVKPLKDVIGSYTYFADNDVLLAKITPCFENGKLGIARDLANGVGFGSSEFLVLRSRGELHPEFLFYFLAQDRFRKAGEGRMLGAVGHKRIPKEFVQEHPIPCPSLAEQERVVAILDEAFAGIDAAIANAEKNLANARDLFATHLGNAFSHQRDGWSSQKLGDVFQTQTGNTPPKGNAGNYGDYLPLVKPAELRGEFVGETSDGVSEVGASLARVVPPETVLVSCIGNLGKVGITRSRAAFNQQINAILPAKSVALPKFMFYQAMSSRFREQLEDVAACTTIPIVNKSRFNSVEVLLPPLEEQSELVHFLDEMRSAAEALEENYQRKCNALHELKQSILQKAFAGELSAKEAERELAAA